MPYPNPKTKELFNAILRLKNQGEAARFFRDLLTLREIKDFSTRFAIAKLLSQNKYSYETIAKKCHVSTTTVTRVSHWLHHGRSGYKLILSRLLKV
jgi:TrpR-related protein YerC/YecD